LDRGVVWLSFTLAVLILPWPIHADGLGLLSSAPSSRPTSEQSSDALTSTPGQSSVARRPSTFRGRLPQPGFVDNVGQVDGRARLYLRSGRQTLWLTEEALVFDLGRLVKESRAPDEAPVDHRPRRHHPQQERLVFTQEFLGARPGAGIERRQLLPGSYNYYLGNDPARWRTAVPAYGEVVYREVWSGVDLRLNGNGRHLEQEFVVHPGGDPTRIRVAHRGTVFGELRESPPTIYQEIDGKGVVVGGRFDLLGRTAYAFEIDPYRSRYALVIDRTLVYATYLGGTADDKALGIDADDRGHAYA
jgi:hypothetical protein